MLCCVVAVTVFAWVRRLWRLLTLRGNAGEHTTLPPRVYRPAPGSTPEPPAAREPRPLAGAGRRQGLAFALVVGGAAWLVLGEVAVHALGLFASVRDDAIVHVVFHGSGPLLMLLGLAVHPALRGRSPTRQLRWHS